jgi:steroid 5-alpha reductase family enzyme
LQQKAPGEIMSVALILGVNFAILCVIMIALWRYCVMINDVSVIDAFWPLGMVIIAASTFVNADGTLARKAVLFGLTALWGLRLSAHLFTRWRAHGVDPRYAAILGRAMQKKGWSFAKASFVQVFALQAVLLFIVCLPAQLGQIPSSPIQVGWMAYIGAAMALIGIAFETIGDAQLKAFRADLSRKGQVLNTGLWRYTRHPNYFGDALTWWGIWLVAAETRLGLWALIGPILITWLLTRLSGVPMLEYRLAKTRPGYADYVARTSSFFPWPPKRA